MPGSFHRRLEQLEDQRTEEQWCRCPFDRERHREEDERAWTTGEPTPSECDRCGGRRVSIQYVPMEQLRVRP